MNPKETYTPMREPKHCFVPVCKNNSRDTQKVFFAVPNSAKQEWCDAVGISCPKRVLYICEDHLNLQEDVENYRYWITMKGRPKLKPRLPHSLVRTPISSVHQEIFPSKLQCQPDKIKCTAPPQPQSAVSKGQCMDVRQEMVSKMPVEMSAIAGMTSNSGEIEIKVELDEGESEGFLYEALEKREEVQEPRFLNKAVQATPEVQYRAVQACPRRYRSKMVQVNTPLASTVMIHVYDYLCKELELLKMMKGKKIMEALGQVSWRAAQALGVSEFTLTEALGSRRPKQPKPQPKEPEPQPKEPEPQPKEPEPQPKRKRKRTTKQTKSHSAEPTSDGDDQTEQYLIVWAAAGPSNDSAGVSRSAATENTEMEVDCGEVETFDETKDWHVPSPQPEVPDTYDDSTDDALEEEPEIYIKKELPTDDVYTSNPLDIGEVAPQPTHLAPTHAHTAPTPNHSHAHTTTETQTYDPGEDIKPVVVTEYLAPAPSHDHNYHMNT